MNHPNFSDVFTQGAQMAPTRGAGVRMVVRGGGQLTLPSGVLAIGDPLDPSSISRVDRVMQPGAYPVDVALAETEGGRLRLAAARVSFSTEAVRDWVPVAFFGNTHVFGTSRYGVFLPAEALESLI